MFAKKLLLILIPFLISFHTYSSSSDSERLQDLREELEEKVIEHQRIEAFSRERSLTTSEQRELALLEERIEVLRNELGLTRLNHDLIESGQHQRGPSLDDLSTGTLVVRPDESDIAELERRRRQLEATRLNHEMIEAGDHSRGPSSDRTGDDSQQLLVVRPSEDDVLELERRREALEAARIRHEMIEAGTARRGPTAEEIRLQQQREAGQARRGPTAEEIRLQQQIEAGQARRGPTAEEIRQHQLSLSQESDEAELARRREELEAARRRHQLIEAGQARRGPSADEMQTFQAGVEEGQRRAATDSEVVRDGEDAVTETGPRLNSETAVLQQTQQIQVGPNGVFQGPNGVIQNAESGGFNINAGDGATINLTVVQGGDPVQTEPEQTEPEQTEPEQTEPEQTEPEQTEPEQTEPEQTEPEQTEPVQTDPVQTDPEPTIPQETCFDIESDITMSSLNRTCVARLGNGDYDQRLAELNAENSDTAIIDFMEDVITERALRDVLIELRIAEMPGAFGNVEDEEREDFETARERFQNEQCDDFSDLESISERKQSRLQEICQRDACYYYQSSRRSSLLDKINTVLPVAENRHANTGLKLLICGMGCTEQEDPRPRPTEDDPEETGGDPEEEGGDITLEEPIEFVPFTPQMIPIPIPGGRPVAWPGIVY